MLEHVQEVKKKLSNLYLHHVFGITPITFRDQTVSKQGHKCPNFTHCFHLISIDIFRYQVNIHCTLISIYI